ncbi:2OG-Fe(II)oxygenase superfamily protein [Colletotrichum fioriniae PJ7]|uniref:2OG-Fe(II)oxygenase superfamily protein n=1 Tax=Colletotrichum fioriniae PJ7 TaxID=1445577 RepID=A0A010QYT3_9PEZI|nr:2OG-Fe(II)oxygenase superfamily protein [Colletotrichum fioriniae PJ7]
MISFFSTATFALAATLVAPVLSQDQKPIPEYVCTHPPYKVHMISKSPLVVYIVDFITPAERLHLLEMASGTFTHSGVIDASGGKTTHNVRTSQSTSLWRDDVVRCIEERAIAFQGYGMPKSHVEPLQLVKYGKGQQYHFHTDWFTDPAHTRVHLGGNRLSSFFGYVSAINVTGGGTNFPLLDAPSDERWCSFVDCDEPWERGVTFRPLEGNFVYWENLHADGSGDQRNLHAGLPVTGGQKVGMNIWTRQAPLSKDIRGD